MNKAQKAVEQAKLDAEKAVLLKLRKAYQQAADDCAKKIKLQTGKIDVLMKDWDKLDDMQKSVLQSQIYQRKYQLLLKGQIDSFLTEMNKSQHDTVEGYLKACYEDGYIGSMYDLYSQKVPIISPINQKQAVKAVTLNSKVSKKLYGSYVTELKKRIQSEISRGVSTGLSYGEMARNLNMQANIGFNKAMRIARTEGHGVQVQATNDAQHAAKKAGADIVKQWDAALDARTRDSHRILDGEIRELDEKFSNGMMFPSDPAGGAAEVINCRCALLQRARWALDKAELETLKERAAYYGLDKTQNFEEFKQKYLTAAKKVEVVAIYPVGVKTLTIEAPKPKKEYLTEKKLKEKIAEADNEIAELEALLKKNPQIALLQKKIDDLNLQKTEWNEKLNKKLVTKETKKLNKEKSALLDEKAALEDELSKRTVKTYSNIWKDDVTTADYGSKMGSIQAKKDYFEKKILYAADADEMKKWKGLIDQLEDFEKNGAEYYEIQKKIKKAEQSIKQIDSKLDKIKKTGKIPSQVDDAFTQERKDAAHWFTDQNGGVKGADGVLRPTCGDVWQNASRAEKNAIYEYTQSYHKFNEPLRGYEYGTNKYLGVGKVDLDDIGVHYGGYKRGEIKAQIDAMTSIIEKSSYTDDIWVQRGCDFGGMDKFFDLDPNDFSLSESELSAKLMGTTPTEYGFFSTGVSKGKGFSSKPIIMNIYAPSGTKMMYAEPFSAFGMGSGRGWDGIAKQSSFGSEAEMIFQRGTQFRVTKVKKSGGKIYIDMEVIYQEVY